MSATLLIALSSATTIQDPIHVRVEMAGSSQRMESPALVKYIIMTLFSCTQRACQNQNLIQWEGEREKEVSP